MKDLLTILIPTSPIPSHPSTAIMDETLSKLREYPQLRECKIIIMADGVHKSLEHRRRDYYNYLNNISGVEMILFDSHTHQAEMTNVVLKQVKTPLILFCEHDTSPIGDVPFESICNALLKSEEINYVRFHIFHDILPEHKYLMLDKVNIEGVPLQRTIQWSQRPHIAKKHWYQKILNNHFTGSKTMIEDVMHSIVQEDYKSVGKDNFGLSIYAPDGNMLRSYHSDGRGSDEKIITG